MLDIAYEWQNGLSGIDLHIYDKHQALSGYRRKLAKGSNTVAKIATAKVVR